MTMLDIKRVVDENIKKHKLPDFLKEPLKTHMVRIDWLGGRFKGDRVSPVDSHLITLAYSVRSQGKDLIRKETLRIQTRYRYGYIRPYVTYVYIDREPDFYPLVIYKHTVRERTSLDKVFTLSKLIQKWVDYKVRTLKIDPKDLSVSPYFEWMFMTETEAVACGVRHITSKYSEAARIKYYEKKERKKNA